MAVEIKLVNGKEVVTVEGKKIFDPRNSIWKVSDNPALILGDIIHNHFTKEPLGKDFWEEIGKMADYCDDAGFHLNIRSI